MAQEQVSTEYIPIEEHCYGPSSRHTLDLYRPPPLVSARGQTVQKVLLVWLHGGGWVDRSKDEFGHVARGLVRAGAGIISVAMVNYHLSPRTRPPSLIHPTHVLDVARALCCRLAAHEREAALWVCGHSAGAHIAGLLALDPTYLNHQHEGDSAQEKAPAKENEIMLVNVAGWIGIAGIYDLPRLRSDFPSYKEAFLDFAFGEDESSWHDNSPQHLHHADHSRSPWLVVHSVEDELVNTVQSLRFVQHLESLGVAATYHEEAKGGSHWEGVHSLAYPESPLANLIINFVLEARK